MTIEKTVTDKEVKLSVVGRLDTSTAPMLEQEIKALEADITSLIFDFEALEYISSAGLRVLLSAQKMMNKQGSMVVRHVNETISEVFDITGFSDILTVE